jgi:hypothetical protein
VHEMALHGARLPDLSYVASSRYIDTVIESGLAS